MANQDRRRLTARLFTRRQMLTAAGVSAANVGAARLGLASVPVNATGGVGKTGDELGGQRASGI